MIVERSKILAAYLRTVYSTYKWLRLVLCVGIGIAGFLLWRISGGFPPWAWRFLLQVAPQLPELWKQRGFAILLPFVGLLFQLIALLIIWGGLLIMLLRILSHWRQERRELQHFDQDVQKAHDLTYTMQQDILHTSPTLPLPAPPQPRDRISVGAGAAVDAGKGPLWPPAIGTLPSWQASIPPARAATRAPSPPPHSPRPYSNQSQLLAASGLDTGIKRKGKPNEDSLFAFEHTRAGETGTIPVGLFVVADGMGGHENGQEASQVATRVLRETLLPALQHGPEDEVFPELLVEGIHRANLALYQRNRQQHGDMGTTLTAAIIFGHTAYIANVGDSRTYLYRSSQGLSQITRDHSTVAQLVEAGAITRDEVYTHPIRNVIYRSLGRQASEEVDTFTVPLQAGDILLLCSDGLWEMVRDPEIEMIIRASYPHPSQTRTMLIQAALNRGGKDNISVVVVYMHA